MEEDKESNKNSKNEQIELKLSDLYDFRFNVVKSRVEFKPKNKGEYRVVGRIELNSLRRELDAKGITTTSENIRSILESSFSKSVNPVKEYFLGLDKLSIPSSETIKELAKTVLTTDSDRWREYLTRWLIGVIANALDDDRCLNQVCIVLTGEQGIRKTTWLDNLCPEILKSYLYTGKIDPNNKDIQTLIAESIIINIDDQLTSLNKKSENELKNYITMPKVKYRRPYDIYIEEYPHLASFVASVNGNDFLTDPSGSRRFLPFEVKGIDIDKALSVNMDDVYTEAMSLYKLGYRYWFNNEEIDELHQYSQAFHVQTPEYELLVRAFVQPEVNDKEKYFMTTTEVITYLERWTNTHLRSKQMGDALSKLGFARVSKYLPEVQRSVYGYLLKKIDPNPFIDKL